MKVEKVFINKKNKDDQPYVNRNGEKYARVVLVLDDGRKPSAMAYTEQEIADCKALEGKEVKLDVEENGQYLNFKIPNKLDELERRVAHLEVMLEKKDFIEEKSVQEVAQEQKEEIKVDSLPF